LAKGRRSKQAEQAKERNKRENATLIRSTRSAEALHTVADDDLLGADTDTQPEFKVLVAEYHVKHNLPPPTSSGNTKGTIYTKRKTMYEEMEAKEPMKFVPAKKGGLGFTKTMPKCQGGEAACFVCNMDPHCEFYAKQQWSNKAGKHKSLGWHAHTCEKDRSDKLQLNKYVRDTVKLEVAKSDLASSSERHSKHKTVKNSHALDEAKANVEWFATQLEMDPEEVEWMESRGKPQTNTLKPMRAAEKIAHLYSPGHTNPTSKTIRSILCNEVNQKMDDNYISSVKKAGKEAYRQKCNLDLGIFPRYIEACRKKGHRASMSALPLEKMREDIAILLNEEWARRMEEDPSLPGFPEPLTGDVEMTSMILCRRVATSRMSITSSLRRTTKHLWCVHRASIESRS
jgi:hypothetical protein